jgi:RimJ/RimL family protein N-acetyltransferase
LKDKYIFKSDRLGFRNWTKEDLTEFSKLNADSDVMEHFPKPLTFEETAKLVERLQSHYEKNGYTYFATEIVETGEFIGFIGLAYQEACGDFWIWSPARELVGHGVGKNLLESPEVPNATEGAKRCVEYFI